MSLKFYMLNEYCAHSTVCLFAELIATVEAFAECFYLIAITSEVNKIVCAVVLKVKHKLLMFVVECYAHNILNRLHLQRYNTFSKFLAY